MSVNFLGISVSLIFLSFAYATCYNRLEVVVDTFLQELLTVLTQSPGSLMYHLVLTFSVVGALQAGLSHWRNSQFPQGRRLVIGLCMLLSIRLGAFFLAGAAWQGLVNEHLVLPPVDRAANLISLLVIIWMWSFPEPSRLADAATWLLGLLGLTGLALNLVWWVGQGSGIEYNGSWPDLIGQVAAISLIVIGGVILLLRKPNGWGYGIGMLGIALAGHVAHLALPVPQGDYSGVLRLAQMAYYPYLFALPQRFPVTVQPATKYAEPVERTRPNIDLTLLENILYLSGENDPGKICQAITRSLSAALLADICLLVMPPNEQNEIIIQCGFDLIREENLPGSSFSAKSLPLISTALTRRLPLRLPASSTSGDLRILGSYLHVARPGHLLFAPAVSPDNTPIAGLLLLSPYSNRAWASDDQAILLNFATAMAQLLQQTQTLAYLETEADQTREMLDSARAEVEALQNENENLRFQVQIANEQSEKNLARAESLVAVIAAQGEARLIPSDQKPEASIMESAELESSRLQSLLHAQQPAIPEPDYLEGELRLALEEVARLKSALSDADQRGLASKNENNGDRPINGQQEEIANIVQEMRQPMSSVTGYTDFLLGESVGILGALQRKFLERIKISTERMSQLVNELLRATTSEASGGKSAASGAIDLYTVIENAIAESMDEIRAREINLRIDVPEELPPLNADEDAIRQVLIKLIDNAKDVTPLKGEITLRASIHGGDHRQGYVLIQISDQGGGIPSEFVPHLFSRFSHANGKPIPGTGGTSSHLSIVKMLVENNGGRIWVDSLPDIGSTFSILLPVASQELFGDEPEDPLE